MYFVAFSVLKKWFHFYDTNNLKIDSEKKQTKLTYVVFSTFGTFKKEGCCSIAYSIFVIISATSSFS